MNTSQMANSDYQKAFQHKTRPAIKLRTGLYNTSKTKQLQQCWSPVEV